MTEIARWRVPQRVIWQTQQAVRCIQRFISRMVVLRRSQTHFVAVSAGAVAASGTAKPCLRLLVRRESVRSRIPLASAAGAGAPREGTHGRRRLRRDDARCAGAAVPQRGTTLR
jgi:hypothetical protein